MPYMHTVVPNLRRLGLITERTERPLEAARHDGRERGGREGRAGDELSARRQCASTVAIGNPGMGSTPGVIDGAGYQGARQRRTVPVSRR